MFDSTPRDRIIAAAMELAATEPWSQVSLLNISQKAGLSLAELREEFCSKEAIFGAFVRKVDDTVLRKVSAESGAEESARERLFDVLMTRFEVMTPYRPAIASIAKDCQVGSAWRSLCRLLGSNYWMLSAADISADGAKGAVRLAGVMAIYSAVLPIWLKDDEPGLPKTMAALDKRLHRGESWIQGANNLCSAAKELFCRFKRPRKNGGSDGATASDTASGGGGLTGEIIPPDTNPQGGAA